MSLATACPSGVRVTSVFAGALVCLVLASCGSSSDQSPVATAPTTSPASVSTSPTPAASSPTTQPSPPPLRTSIKPADFPRLAFVKRVSDGVGPWTQYKGDPYLPSGDVIGAEPPQCLTARPYQGYMSTQKRAYWGDVVGTPPNVRGVASVTIYRYPTVAQAQRTLRRLERFMRECPSTREWVCTSCDGVWNATIVPVSLPGVGAQSLAWQQRVDFVNDLSDGFGMAVQQSGTVVVTKLGHVLNPVSGYTDYAPPPRLQIVELARRALQVGL